MPHFSQIVKGCLYRLVNTCRCRCWWRFEKTRNFLLKLHRSLKSHDPHSMCIWTLKDHHTEPSPTVTVPWVMPHFRQIIKGCLYRLVNTCRCHCQWRFEKTRNFLLKLHRSAKSPDPHRMCIWATKDEFLTGNGFFDRKPIFFLSVHEIRSGRNCESGWEARDDGRRCVACPPGMYRAQCYKKLRT
jgi:hypothetical protein